MKAKAEELKTRQIQEQGEQQRKNMEADLRHNKQRSEYEDVLARRRYEDQLAQQVPSLLFPLVLFRTLFKLKKSINI